jgi:sialic acid synthase SpsE
VKSNYDLIQLDKVIKEDNFEVTKKYIISSRFNEAINSSPINSILIKLLESGKVTLEKVKSNEVNNQYLIKQVGKSLSESKKHNYVGHVTLLR